MFRGIARRGGTGGRSWTCPLKILTLPRAGARVSEAFISWNANCPGKVMFAAAPHFTELTKRKYPGYKYACKWVLYFLLPLLTINELFVLLPLLTPCRAERCCSYVTLLSVTLPVGCSAVWERRHGTVGLVWHWFPSVSVVLHFPDPLLLIWGSSLSWLLTHSKIPLFLGRPLSGDKLCILSPSHWSGVSYSQSHLILRNIKDQIKRASQLWSQKCGS